jgi:hypothetical protein
MLKDDYSFVKKKRERKEKEKRAPYREPRGLAHSESSPSERGHSPIS